MVPPAGAPHASFSFFLLLNPRPSSPRPVPASLRCAVGSRWHCATARPDDARAPPVHGRGRRPLRERGGRSRRWGVGSPGCRLPSVDGRGRVRPARRGRRRASGAVGGYVKPRMNGEQRCAIPAMAEGRRRGARKRSAPCRTRRRRGRRRGQCGRDRRAGRIGPVRASGPGAGAGSTGGGTSRTLLGRLGLRSDRAGPPSRRRGTGP